MFERLKSFLGFTVGAGVPAAMFFTQNMPPRAPEAALLVSAVALYQSLRLKAEPADPPTRKRASTQCMVGALACIVGYLMLLSITTVRPIAEERERVQIGFGMAEWSMTKHYFDHAAPKGFTTPEKALIYAGTDNRGAATIWHPWCIQLASTLLLSAYFAAVWLWSSAFVLAKPPAPQGHS